MVVVVAVVLIVVVVVVAAVVVRALLIEVIVVASAVAVVVAALWWQGDSRCPSGAFYFGAGHHARARELYRFVWPDDADSTSQSEVYHVLRHCCCIPGTSCTANIRAV